MISLAYFIALKYLNQAICPIKDQI